MDFRYRICISSNDIGDAGQEERGGYPLVFPHETGRTPLPSTIFFLTSEASPIDVLRNAAQRKKEDGF
jgi:hypothetical protein